MRSEPCYPVRQARRAWHIPWSGEAVMLAATSHVAYGTRSPGYPFVRLPRKGKSHAKAALYGCPTRWWLGVSAERRILGAIPRQGNCALSGATGGGGTARARRNDAHRISGRDRQVAHRI